MADERSLPPSVLALPQEVRDAMGRAIAEAVVDAIEELIAETSAQAELLGVSYQDAAIAIRTRAETDGTTIGEAAEVRGREIRQERGIPFDADDDDE